MASAGNTQILVGTDGSATADVAVQRAGETARSAGATLHVVTAVDGHSRVDDTDKLPEDLRWAASPGAQADEILRRAQALIGPGVEVELHNVLGDPADVLVELAAELHADLIVVGNKGMQGMSGYVRPTVPNRVSHRAGCDVLIVATSPKKAA